MGRPRLLDLFCCAGGAAKGYAEAGFEVVGVDKYAQPNYPYEFHRADALTFDLSGFDVVHASPPCQLFTKMQRARGQDDWEHHPDLVEPTRSRLQASGLPYVIENVEGAPLLEPVRICGTAFALGCPGFELRRHRLFESNVKLVGTPCNHRLPSLPIMGHGVNADFKKRHGRMIYIEDRRLAMGIDWTDRNELAEAIPPAYTRFIGLQLLAHLGEATGLEDDGVRVPMQLGLL